MRANTPACQLGPVTPIPQPKFKIGDTVRFKYAHKSDRSYYIRMYVRYLIRKDRKVIDRLRAQGYLDLGPKLPEQTKKEIREIVKRLRSAKTAQIVGIVPWSMYNIDTTSFNECYVGGVRGASAPMHYEYHVLIRFKNAQGNRIALVSGLPMGSDNSFELTSKKGSL